MSSGMIRLNEEIDQVIKLLDGVVGSYSQGSGKPDGLSSGAAAVFYNALQKGQGEVDQKILELDAKLKLVTDAIRDAVADQRATEAETADSLRVFYNELEAAENGTTGKGSPQVDEPDTKAPGVNASGRPDGSQ